MPLAVLSLFLLPAPGLADRPATTPYRTSAESTASPSTDAIGLGNDSYERLTVKVRIGEDGPFRFLVDTGSDRTAISRQLAKRLGLERGTIATIHSSTEASQVQLASLNSLKFSRRTIDRVDAPLLDASSIGADGLLGLDSLASHSVLFDFAGGTLSIRSRGEPEPALDPNAIIVRAKRREGRLIITDAEAAGVPLGVILDTGSQYSIGNPALRRKLEKQGAISSLGPMSLVSVTGQSLPGELATIRRMRIGGVNLDDMIVVFADAHTFRILGLESRPALLLGMSTLRSFDQVSIDFIGKRLGLVLPNGGHRESKTPGR